MPEKVAFICVQITEREGRYHAYSDDLPSFHLVGTSLDDIHADTVPVIKQLYKLTTGLDVRVDRAVDARSLEAPEEPSGRHQRYWAAPVREAAAA